MEVTYGDDDDPEDFEIGNFPADRLVDVFLNLVDNLKAEGYESGDILFALNMASADLSTAFRSDE